VLLNQDEAAALAIADLTLADHRVLFAALGRMDDFGHAIFKEGELLELLSISRATLYRSKTRLYEGGFLAEKTGADRCVWVAFRVAFREGSGSHCCEHRQY
jgi:hypothetical protein